MEQGLDQIIHNNDLDHLLEVLMVQESESRGELWFVVLTGVMRYLDFSKHSLTQAQAECLLHLLQSPHFQALTISVQSICPGVCANWADLLEPIDTFLPEALKASWESTRTTVSTQWMDGSDDVDVFHDLSVPAERLINQDAINLFNVIYAHARACIAAQQLLSEEILSTLTALAIQLNRSLEPDLLGKSALILVLDILFIASSHEHEMVLEKELKFVEEDVDSVSVIFQLVAVIKNFSMLENDEGAAHTLSSLLHVVQQYDQSLKVPASSIAVLDEIQIARQKALEISAPGEVVQESLKLRAQWHNQVIACLGDMLIPCQRLLNDTSYEVALLLLNTWPAGQPMTLAQAQWGLLYVPTVSNAPTVAMQPYLFTLVQLMRWATNRTGQSSQNIKQENSESTESAYGQLLFEAGKIDEPWDYRWGLVGTPTDWKSWIEYGFMIVADNPRALPFLRAMSQAQGLIASQAPQQVYEGLRDLHTLFEKALSTNQTVTRRWGLGLICMKQVLSQLSEAIVSQASVEATLVLVLEGLRFWFHLMPDTYLVILQQLEAREFVWQGWVKLWGYALNDIASNLMSEKELQWINESLLQPFSEALQQHFPHAFKPLSEENWDKPSDFEARLYQVSQETVATFLSHRRELSTLEVTKRYRKILVDYPDSTGWSPQKMLQQQWAHKVNAIFMMPVESSYAIKIVLDGQLETGYLPNALGRRLFTESGALNIDEQYSTPKHAVTQWGNYFFKIIRDINSTPYVFGLEIAVQHIHHGLGGDSLAKGCLCQIEVKGMRYWLWITEAIPGERLNILLDMQSERLNQLSSKHFTELFLMSIFTLQEDGQPRNFIVRDENNAEQVHVSAVRLVGFDNGHAFVQPKRGVGHSFKKNEIFNVCKSILFLLPTMDKLLHRASIEKLQLIRPMAWVQSMRAALSQYNLAWSTLSAGHAISGTESLPIVEMSEAGWAWLVFLLYRLQQQFKQTPSLTHSDLFTRLIPGIAKDFVIHRQRSLSSALTLVQYFSGIESIAYSSKPICPQSHELTSTRLSEDIRQLQLRTTHLYYALKLKEEDLNQINFAQMLDAQGKADEAWQRFYLELIKLISPLEQLNLAHCQVVTDEDICIFLKNNSGLLQLNLNHCSAEVTGRGWAERQKVTHPGLEIRIDGVYLDVHPDKQRYKKLINSSLLSSATDALLCQTIDSVSCIDELLSLAEEAGYISLEENLLDIPDTEYLIKVLIVGDIGAGKTSIIKRYVHNYFSMDYKSTIGVDFALKILRWDKSTVVRIQFWDIAGQERFGNMTKVYYKDAVGVIVLFDITQIAPFESVRKWKDDLDNKVQLEDGSNIPAILMANKSDLSSGLDEKYQNSNSREGFCVENNFINWIETSAKDDYGIEEGVRQLVAQLLVKEQIKARFVNRKNSGEYLYEELLKSDFFNEFAVAVRSQHQFTADSFSRVHFQQLKELPELQQVILFLMRDVAHVHLNLSGCKQLDDASLKELIITSPQLSSLNLSGCELITGQGWLELLSQYSLEHLCIAGTAILGRSLWENLDLSFADWLKQRKTYNIGFISLMDPWLDNFSKKVPQLGKIEKAITYEEEKLFLKVIKGYCKKYRIKGQRYLKTLNSCPNTKQLLHFFNRYEVLLNSLFYPTVEVESWLIDYCGHIAEGLEKIVEVIQLLYKYELPNDCFEKIPWHGLRDYPELQRLGLALLKVFPTKKIDLRNCTVLTDALLYELIKRSYGLEDLLINGSQLQGFDWLHYLVDKRIFKQLKVEGIDYQLPIFLSLSKLQRWFDARAHAYHHHEEQDISEVIKAYQVMVRLQLDWTRQFIGKLIGYYTLAQACWKIHDTEQARIFFEEGGAVEPTVTLYLNYGHCLFCCGAYEAALISLGQVLTESKCKITYQREDAAIYEPGLQALLSNYHGRDATQTAVTFVSHALAYYLIIHCHLKHSTDVSQGAMAHALHAFESHFSDSQLLVSIKATLGEQANVLLSLLISSDESTLVNPKEGASTMEHEMNQAQLNAAEAQVVTAPILSQLIAQLNNLSLSTGHESIQTAVKAILNNDVKQLRQALRDNEHCVLEKDAQEFRLLHYAATLGNGEAIDTILAVSGAKVTAKSALGLQAIHCAALKGNTSALSALLARSVLNEEKSIDVHVQKRNISINALHASLLCGQWGSVTVLLTYLKNQSADAMRTILEVPGIGNLLHLAVLARDPWILRQLIDHPVILNAQDRSGAGLYNALNFTRQCTPLQFAIRLNNQAAVWILLSHPQVDLNRVNEQGFTALHTAANYGRYQTVRLLLDHFPNANAAWSYLQLKDKSSDARTAYQVARQMKKQHKPAQGVPSSETQKIHYKDYQLTTNQLASKSIDSFGRQYRAVDAQPETRWHTRNLVLQGGGPAGIGLVGGLMALGQKLGERDDSLDNIQRVGGTSAGAITGMLLALGMEPQVMRETLDSLDMMQLLEGVEAQDIKNLNVSIESLKSNPTFKTFIQQGLQLIKRVYGCRNEASALWQLVHHRGQICENLLNLQGLCPGEKFLEWLDTVVNQRMQTLHREYPQQVIEADCEGLTLGRLAELVELRVPGLKHFHAVVLQISPKREILDIHSESSEWAQVPLAKLVRASASIPGVFHPVSLTRIINQQVQSIQCVDGGLLMNYPIKLFDRLRYIKRYLRGDEDYELFNHETLGLRLVESEDLQSVEPPTAENLTLKDLLSSVMEAYWKAEQLIADFEHKFQWRSVVIPKMGYGLLDFNLPPEGKIALLESGAAAVEAAFNKQAGLEHCEEAEPKSSVEKPDNHSSNKSAGIFKSTAVLLSNVAGRYGYKCIQVPKDGNCFFHAVLTQLPNSRGETADSLRQKVVLHIASNFDNYRDFMSENINCREDFVALMSRDSEWVDELLITATSHVLDSTLVIIQNNGVRPKIYRQRSINGLIMLGYEVGTHYQGLTINEKITRPRFNLKEIINDTKQDHFNPGEQQEVQGVGYRNA